jgi:prevent-host-death family protein
MAWQLQEAKQRLSALVQQVLDHGPQVITRHGEEVVVVVSIAEYRRITGRTPDFKRFLLSAPDIEELAIQRDSRPTRTFDL